MAKIWDASSGSTWLSYGEHDNSVLAVDWSPDGARIVSGCADGRVLVWHPNTGNTLAEVFTHNDSVTDVAWSPSGNELATSSKDNTSRVWKWSDVPEDRELIATFGGHYGGVNSIDWSPDGSKLVSGGDDGVVRIWESDTARELATLDDHSGPITTVAWSLDGSKIATGSLDSSVKVWNADTGRLESTSYAHEGGVHSVSWLPTNGKLFSAGADSIIKMWEPSTGRVILNFTGHRDTVRVVAPSPDAKMVASGSDDQTAKTWNMPIPPAPELLVPTGSLRRGASLKLKAIIKDYAGSQGDLLPEFKYRPHTTTQWTDEYLSFPSFTNDGWEVDFTPDRGAPLGGYDFKARLNTANEIFSPWSVEESPIEVINNLPTARIWDVPLEIHRGETKSMSVWVTDTETSPEDISVKMEYSADFVEDWRRDIFSEPMFNETADRWDVNFTFPVTSKVGEYKLRARCIDRDLGVSPWDYHPQALKVLNNPPVITDLRIEPNRIYRGGTGEIQFDVSDVEDGTLIKDVQLQIGSPSNEWVILEPSFDSQASLYKSSFNTGIESETGFYDARVKMEDSGSTISQWYYYNSSFKVINNPPVATQERITFQLFAGASETFSLRNFASDTEDPNKELTWQVNSTTTDKLDVKILNSSWIRIISDKGLEPGQEMIEFNIVDNDGAFTTKKAFVNIFDPVDRPAIEVRSEAPLDRSKVGSSHVILKWNVKGVEAPVSYELYWGTVRDQLDLLKRGLNVDHYKKEGLKDGEKYWWRIGAKVYGIPYTFKSETWSFISEKGFIPGHEVEISFDRDDIQIHPEENITFNLTLTNSGNVPEIVTVEVVGLLKDFVRYNKSVRIDPEETISIPMTIHGDNSLKPDDYVLSTIVQYSEREDSGQIDVSLRKRTTGSDGEGGFSQTLLYIALLVLITGLILLITIIVVKRKKGVEPEPVRLTEEPPEQPVPTYSHSPYFSPEPYPSSTPTYSPRGNINVPQMQASLPPGSSLQSGSGQQVDWDREAPIAPRSMPRIVREIPPDLDTEPEEEEVSLAGPEPIEEGRLLAEAGSLETDDFTEDAESAAVGAAPSEITPAMEPTEEEVLEETETIKGLLSGYQETEPEIEEEESEVFFEDALTEIRGLVDNLTTKDRHLLPEGRPPQEVGTEGRKEGGGPRVVREVPVEKGLQGIMEKLDILERINGFGSDEEEEAGKGQASPKSPETPEGRKGRRKGNGSLERKLEDLMDYYQSEYGSEDTLEENIFEDIQSDLRSLEDLNGSAYENEEKGEEEDDG